MSIGRPGLALAADSPTASRRSDRPYRARRRGARTIAFAADGSPRRARGEVRHRVSGEARTCSRDAARVARLLAAS
jgi:hypothetical protein